MKKIYMLGLALSVFSMAKAQTTVINEDFESHQVGPLYGGAWDNWYAFDDVSYDMSVTAFRASAGTKAGFIGPANSDKGQDALLVMPSVYTSGTVTSEWKMYVPADSVGYFNLQSTATPGESFAFECSINTYTATDTLTGGYSLQHHLVWTFTQASTTYTYAYIPLPTDQWFTLKQVMDLDSAKLHLYVNGTEATYFQPQVGNDWPGADKSVAAFDFYSLPDTSNSAALTSSYYLDNITVTTQATPLAINNVVKNSALVSSFPNPCKEYLNLSIKGGDVMQHVEVYNILGQKVMDTNPNASSTTLNTQRFAAGTYTAKVTTKNGLFSKEFVVK